MKLNIMKAIRDRLLSIPKSETVEEIRAYLPAPVLDMEKVLLGKINLLDLAMDNDRVIKAGELVRIHLKRKANCYVASRMQGRIVKESLFTVQASVDYYNKRKVKEAHESGEREKRGLPDSTIPLSKVLRYNLNTDNVTIAFGTIDNPKCERQVQWYLDDKPCQKSDVAEWLKASEFRDSDTDWLYLNPDNIVSMK